MKKVIIGLAAIAAIIALRLAAGRGGQKMREHCMKMAGRCKQMMAGQAGEHGQPDGMREHCEEMAAHFKGHGQTAETKEHLERQAPQFAGHEEAVGTA